MRNLVAESLTPEFVELSALRHPAFGRIRGASPAAQPLAICQGLVIVASRSNQSEVFNSW